MKINLILPVVSSIWIMSELALIRFRRARSPRDSQDAGSLVWLNVVIYSSVTFAVTCAFSGIGFIPRAGLTLAWIGLILILLGLAFRWWAIFTLRQYFTVNVAIQTDQRIIRQGVYGCVRHPAYLGALISFVGLGLALRNWLAIMLLLVPITIAFIKRIEIEERVLSQAFGNAYRDYCNTTWRLIPGLY